MEETSDNVTSTTSGRFEEGLRADLANAAAVR